MKKILIILYLIMVASVVIGQNSTITVEFTLNGKKVELNNDFEMFFVTTANGQKVIIKPNISQNTFKVPDFCGQTKGHIVFKYKKMILGLGLNNFEYNQNMKWEIGFDKKPYNKEYPIKEANAKETKGISYIILNPLEQGEGIVTTISIVDFKRYFRESQALLE